MTRSLVLVFLSILSASLFAEERTRFMVVMRDEAPATSLRLVANSAEAAEHRVRRYEHAGSMSMELTEAEAAELRRSPNVETVEPVVLMMAQDVGASAELGPSDPQITPWGLAAIHAQNVWPVTRGKSVNVAIIDSGIESKHPDVAHAYAGGTNILDAAKSPEDDFGHGTHVAGIIAAADNNIGIIGVAPDVKLWAVKALYQDGSGHDDYVVAALDWLIARKQQSGGAWVANMSFGGLGTNALAKAVQRALEAGIILVASAGNTGTETGLLYPAGYDGVISVGAVDSERHVASFSTRGYGLDIAAPGVGVMSTYLRNKSSFTEVRSGEKKLTAYSVVNSGTGAVEAPIINCGYGRLQDIPAEAPGRICVIQIQRTPWAPDYLPLWNKAVNAKEAGAVGVVFYNDNDTTHPDYARWLLWRDAQHQTYNFPLTVAMSYADGVKLLYESAGPIRMTFGFRDYHSLNGTSMAAPHVTGTVALMLALAPNASSATIQSVLERTTTEIDMPGWDYNSGWGMVDALNAARMIAPASFDGSTPPPPAPPSRRRSTRS